LSTLISYDELCPTPKVWILGVAGSGKSTLARRLSATLSTRLVELDDLFWSPGWIQAEPAYFLDGVGRLLSAPSWTVEGTYDLAIDNFVSRSNLIVWLDVPLWRVWPKVIRRTFRRLWTKEKFCGGNQESFRSVFGPKSILLHSISSHADESRKHRELVAKLRSEGKQVLRIVTYPDKEGFDRLLQELTEWQ
jgi:adenylate kinase family enzyme